ncbi:MAG: 23S rRNA (uracil(1939)-C(5))-methyltransferase RlmD [Bacteroidia bacterium]|nr:23S rRNA (uracil(1939)-C(5))-methyltransferase RlmD [Bacteroidia bacterium]
MPQKKNKHPVLYNLEIIDIASEGKAIARQDDLVIFVTNVIPGDIVDVQVTRCSKNFREGFPVFFHTYSSKRVAPVCSHFGICGGCKWQNLPYAEQLFYKQKQVIDNLERIGKIEAPLIKPILPSKNIFHYRNKLEYTFSNRRWLTKNEIPENGETVSYDMNGLGFHIPKMFDKVLDINTCFLQKEPSNTIRLAVKKYALENKLSFFDLRIQEGFLRNLIIRTTSGNDLMVIVVFYNDNVSWRTGLLDYISESFPEITSLIYIINNKRNDSIADLTPYVYKGKDHIVEEMEGLKFKIGSKSFFQTNSEQVYQFYKIIREFADLKASEIVYDLYTGTGAIANFIAPSAKKVVAIEYIQEAIEDAKENSRINGINNAAFFAGDIKDILTNQFIEQQGRPDVIILDPPRAGVHRNVIDAILFSNPRKVVYVSCNPATQSRDVHLLSEKYKVSHVQPVDMFPHTHHVENIILLEQK